MRDRMIPRAIPCWLIKIMTSPRQPVPWAGTQVLQACCVTNPPQLKHCVDKGETPICRALSRMLVRRTFLQSEPNKVLRLGCPNRGADEQMVQLNLHTSKSKASASSGASTSS